MAILVGRTSILPVWIVAFALVVGLSPPSGAATSLLACVGVVLATSAVVVLVRACRHVKGRPL
jgi:hypothetical protein